MKFAQLSVLAALVFATQGAFAQTSGAPGATTGAATDASTVTNAGSASVATDTTITDDTTTIDTTSVDALPTGEMANTGGEPQLMLLAGMLLATGGLLIRRKTGAQSL